MSSLQEICGIVFRILLNLAFPNQKRSGGAHGQSICRGIDASIGCIRKLPGFVIIYDLDNIHLVTIDSHGAVGSKIIVGFYGAAPDFTVDTCEMATCHRAISADKGIQVNAFLVEISGILSVFALGESGRIGIVVVAEIHTQMVMPVQLCPNNVDIADLAFPFTVESSPLDTFDNSLGSAAKFGEIESGHIAPGFFRLGWFRRRCEFKDHRIGFLTFGGDPDLYLGLGKGRGLENHLLLRGLSHRNGHSIQAYAVENLVLRSYGAEIQPVQSHRLSGNGLSVVIGGNAFDNGFRHIVITFCAIAATSLCDNGKYRK